MNHISASDKFQLVVGAFGEASTDLDRTITALAESRVLFLSRESGKPITDGWRSIMLIAWPVPPLFFCSVCAGPGSLPDSQGWPFGGGRPGGGREKEGHHGAGGEE